MEACAPGAVCPQPANLHVGVTRTVVRRVWRPFYEEVPL